MENKIVSFRDENGKKVDYAILEQKLINQTEYVAMAPVEHKDHVEIFKIKFDKDWNESLEEVESPQEIDMVRKVSKIKF